MRELAGKTAFVTGGASGIGFALGRAFAEAGMKVMLADIETGALTVAVKTFFERVELFRTYEDLWNQAASSLGSARTRTYVARGTGGSIRSPI
jgi:NAD(P)-dependent dehydrogenase (short-subunit alcohol dehydrogenase family)